MTSSICQFKDLETVKDEAVEFVRLKWRLCNEKACQVFETCKELQTEWLSTMGQPVFDNMLADLWKVFMVRFEILELMCNHPGTTLTSLKTYIEGMNMEQREMVPMVDLSQISVIALIHDEAEIDITSKATSAEVRKAKNRMLEAIRFCVEMCTGVEAAIAAFNGHIASYKTDQAPFSKAKRISVKWPHPYRWSRPGSTSTSRTPGMERPAEWSR